jgi:hypothetical protein
MFAQTTQVVRKPVRFPELEDATKQIDLRVLEEHIRRSRSTMVIETVEPDLERTTLRFRAQPVYPIQRRRFPVLSVAVALLILVGAATWMTLMT